MLGISIYLGENKIQEQREYIKKMKEKGFTSIFTSLHIPEDDPSLYKEELTQLGQIAKEEDMELMADISPNSLQELDLSLDTADQLLDWGLAGLRVDYGIDEDTIIKLSKQMKIALNASTIEMESLRRLKEKGLEVSSLEAWHNFYPRPETGLGWKDFIKRNKWLKEEGLTVMAFIPGDEVLRGPLYEKLPTLERHRGYSPFASFIELKTEGYVDKILVGDIQLSDQSLEQFQAFKEGEICLRCQKELEVDQDFLNSLPTNHTNRADFARDVIRSVESRNYAEMGMLTIEGNNCHARPTGTITIDNENYARYKGEIQITVNSLPADPRVNVLGNVVEEDIPLLPYIKGNQKFSLKWIP